LSFDRIQEKSKNYEINQIIFSYQKKNFYIKKGVEELIFGSENFERSLKLTDDIDEITFNSILGGDILEHTFSKWIKDSLERNDEKYKTLKKDCSIKAGENLKEFILNNLNLNSEKILELLQIYDQPYYYGKVSAQCTYIKYKVTMNAK